MRQKHILFVSLLAICGCAASAPGDEAAQLAPDPERTLPENPPPKPAPTATPATPDVAWRGVPQADSSAAGVMQLSEVEAAQLQQECKPFVDAVAGKSRSRPASDPTRLGVAQALLIVLEDPPSVSGVDSPRCAALLRRDTVAYLAHVRETQALMAIKTVLSLIDQRRQNGKEACSSAAPIPADLGVLAKGPYESKRAEYQAGGWQCLGFDPLGAPQHYQLEVSEEGGSQRVVARLFPAGELTELYVDVPRGSSIDLGTPVLRRAK